MRNYRVVVFLFVAAGCASTPGPVNDSEVMAQYRAYQAAVESGDMSAAKSHLAASRLATVAMMNDSDSHAALSVLSPMSNLRFKKEKISGDEAILIVTSEVGGTEATGRVKMLREKSEWKVVTEMWNLGGGSEFLEEEDPAEATRTPEQKEAIRQLEARGFPRPSGDYLVMSAVNGNLEAVKLFLAAGFPIDSRSQDSTALINAARYEHPEVALYLIEQGADVNATDLIHTTALMHAVESCRMTEVVKALLAHHARLDLKSDGGTDALQLAEWGSCPENVRLLKEVK